MAIVPIKTRRDKNSEANSSVPIKSTPVKQELVELYLRFLWLLDGLKDLPTGGLLGIPDAEELLTNIVRAWQRGEPYPIRKLVMREELGHFNTVRKRVQQLEDAGFIELQTQASDSRVKLVIPTEQTLRYFADCGALLQRIQP
jgi:hypothetical protein